jgi:hypothetical protein
MAVHVDGHLRLHVRGAQNVDLEKIKDISCLALQAAAQKAELLLAAYKYPDVAILTNSANVVRDEMDDLPKDI